MFWRKDGTNFPVKDASTPFVEQGGIVGSAAVFEDITERKQVEERFRRSEERFRATFEQAAVGVAHLAIEGRWLRINQKLCEFVGYSREELLELAFQDITHPANLGADLEYTRQLLAADIQTYSVEKRYYRKDCSIVLVNLTVSLVRELSGEPSYFTTVIEDTSKRKRTEEVRRLHEEPEGRVRERTAQLEEESITLDSVLNSLSEGVLLINRRGWVLLPIRLLVTIDRRA